MYLGPFSSVSRINYKIFTSLGALASTTSVASTSIINNYQTFCEDAKSYSSKITNLVNEYVRSYIDLSEINSILDSLKTHLENLKKKLKPFTELPTLSDVQEFFNSFHTYLQYAKKLQSFSYLKQYFSKDNFKTVFNLLKQYSSIMKQAFSILKSGDFDISQGLDLLFNLISDGSFLDLTKSVFSLLTNNSIPLSEFNFDDLSEIFKVFSDANKEGKLSEVIQRFKTALENWKPPFDKKSFIRQVIHGNTVDYFSKKINELGFTDQKLIEEVLTNPKAIIVESIKDLVTDPKKTVEAAIDIAAKAASEVVDSIFSWFS